MWDKLAQRMLQPINTSVISILGFFDCLLGVWIILPFTSLKDNYTTLHFPEWLIGVVTFLIGATILAGSIKESFKLLATGSALAFVYWFVITVLLFINNWSSPGWIIGLMVAFYSGFVYANLSVNSKNLLNKMK